MNRFSVVRLARTYYVLALLTTRLVAQSYTLTGTNPPGGVQDFPIVIPAAVTNLALSVGGSATTYSHLLLRAGAAPSDTTYDFIAALEGGANAINLELPELRVTNYVLRVRTPAGSLTHAFTVNVTTNAAGFRSASLPATKPLASTNQGTLNAGGWHYYRVEIGSNLPGWRVLLGSAATLPDLYIQRDGLPTTSNWLKRSQALTNDVIAFAASELVPGAYYIGVHQPSGSNPYTLRTEVINFTTLAWDPGATHAGTEVYTHANTNAGDHYFKLTTENTALGAWRTALNVTSGEAQLYLGKGTPPGPATNLYKSERIGSDGFVIPASAFSASEDWYFLVRVETNAQWNLVSGEPFVADLGNVAVDGSSGSGAVPIGAEGMRYFKTTVPANSLAWRLGLNGLNNSVLVRKAFVPLTSVNDLNQPGQMLVVPPYLVGGLLYFVGVSGAPGTVINLDSRQQPFTDLAFGAGTNLTVTGYGYSTYRGS